MKTVGLFFGTFNPIHLGHLAIANFFSENKALQEVWLVVSPQSPFKQKQTLARLPADLPTYMLTALAYLPT